MQFVCFFLFLPNSHDGKFIISGSENQYIYMWKTHHDYAKFSSARRDRNDYWEAIKGFSLTFFFIKLLNSILKFFFMLSAHNAVVTSAVFAPDSHSLIEQMERHRRKQQEERTSSLTATDASSSSSVSSSQSSHHGYGYVLVSADFNGIIKVFVNRVKPKHSSLPVSALS